MNFALVYLVQRLFYRILEFLRHWYVKSVKMYSNWVLDKLSDVDYYLAFRITLKHLFEPLYKDYSLIGYTLGFFFRFWRLVFGGIVYAVIFAVAIGCYLLWLFFPIYLLGRFLFG